MVYLLDPRTGKTKEEIEGGTPVDSLAYAPDGRLASGDAGGNVVLYDVGTNFDRWMPGGHEGNVFALAFTPDGKRLLSGGLDGTVRVWDAAGLRELHTYTWHKSWVSCLAVSPDGMTAAAGSEDTTVVVWDLADE
jgi:WD40 repeat protein